LLLLVGAVDHDALGADAVVGADAGAEAGVDFGELLINQALAQGADAPGRRTLLEWKGRTGPVRAWSALLIRDAVFFFHLLADGFQVLFNKTSNRVDHHLQIFRDGIIHDFIS
jgi:hypothetical protein